MPNAVAYEDWLDEADGDFAWKAFDEGTAAGMRSASRYGRYDLGDNAARITDFLAELDQEVAGQVGAAPAE